MISVIIATRNRADALRNISLPSLLNQTSNNFEVLIWDASDDDATEKVVKTYAQFFETKGVCIRYRHAGRRGSCSQRNDAVKEAKGDIVFFIDDDCLVGSAGLLALTDYFNSFPWLQGAGLPLVDKVPNSPLTNKNSQLKISRKIKDVFFTLFFGGKPGYRIIRDSIEPVRPIIDAPGVAEWLSGGSMAFRKTVFDDLIFDERLERLGGYAMWEDVDFSHRVFLHYREPLLVVNGPEVIHIPAQGDRFIDKANQLAIFLYNSYLIRENFKHYAPYKVLPFIWECRIGRFWAQIAGGCRLRGFIAGYNKYRKCRKNA